MVTAGSLIGKIKGRIEAGKIKGLLASLEAPCSPEELQLDFGDIVNIDVLVKNLGTQTWRSRGKRGGDFLSYHWETQAGESLNYEGLRTSLPRSVPPGGSTGVRLKVSVTAPVENAVLVIDMVREGEAWFSQVGSEPLRIPCGILMIPGEKVAGKSSLPSEDGSQTVEELWGIRAEIRETGTIIGWLDHTTVEVDCILPKLETPGTNWVLVMADKHDLKKDGRWLSLGCGDGNLELWLAEKGVAASVEGVDVSPQAVEIANRAARERGMDNVSFRTMDLNHEILPEESYDVILASMSVHHIRELEKAFDSIYKALRPGGYFVANEYTGPSRMQFTGNQVDLAEELISLLPRELRVNTVATELEGTTVFKDKLMVRSPAEWQEIDPSEAVRSDEIIRVFKKTFDKTWIYPYGGTLMHLVLEHIAGNFDPEEPKDRAIIRLMDLVETKMLEAGVIESDFSIMVGRKWTKKGA